MLNQQKKVATGDESGMAPGETAIGYLNRRHQATVNDKKVGTAAVDATAKAVAQRAVAGKLGQGQRAGETAAQVLNRKKAADPVVDRHAEAEKAAEGLVSNALILPVLKQLRRSTLDQKGVFSAGSGEKTFGPEFDMQLANRIAQSPRLAVKESLVKRLENRPAPVTQGSGFRAGSNKTVATSRIDVNG
jgi:Rod binding domain-containing protein